MVSCSESTSDISTEDSSITSSEELTSEELSTALKTVIINYPVTAVNDDDTTQEVNSDEELEEVITRNNRPNIEFPFDITIDGEIITIENIRDLKELVKRPVRRRPPFKLVFPVTVINEDLSTTEIADSEAMKAYKDGLDEGVKPTLQFPISIEEKDGTIIEMADEDALEAYITEQREEIKNDRADANRPPFKLVFPITVINEDLSTTEIADSEAMKAYKDGLEEGVKPTLQFPISIEEKDGTIIEMADEDALKTYLQENRPERKNKGNRPNRRN
ncbi:hypothetical protein AXE80_13460 [Wenyingzhuangia fucanilytica]|uniref:Uncharacterized protein n=2 Tax=Wenyingzhuangia fucanilytica TaxID=1790137 RepID=A0A1B1Y900_9FLAO|nr:hypothetical protein AXE80_13460 [Wenyingzhuangia fucanilytica]